MSISRWNPKWNFIALGGGVIGAALVGIAALAGWLTLMGISVDDAPSHRILALIAPAGLLLSAGTLLAYRFRRMRLVTELGALIVLLGLISLVEYGLAMGGGIDRLRMPTSLADHLASSARMTPLTALTFQLIGIALVAAARRKGSRIGTLVLATLGSIVIAVAAFGATGDVASLITGNEFNQFQGMGAATALGCIAAGIGILGLASGSEAAVPGTGNLSEATDAAPLVGLALAVLLSLTLFAFQWMIGDRDARIRAKFEKSTIDVVDDIGDRMPSYALALRGSARYIQQSTPLSRQDWGAYIDSLQVMITFPGILGIGYAAHVTAADMAGHLKAVRAIWPEGFRIYPEGDRPEYTPVVLLEPRNERSRQVIGFDHFSEPTRRSAIEQVRDTGEPTISRNIRLYLDAGKPNQFGFQMYMPVYRKRSPVATVVERRNAFMGVVFSPFRIEELMRAVLADRYKGVRVRILDGELQTGAPLVYDSTGMADGSQPRRIPINTLSTGAIILGHRWTIWTTPLPAFVEGEQRSGAWIVLGSGALISVLFAAAIWQLFTIQARARSLAAAQALNAEIENRLRAEQALQAEREQARLRVEALNRELAQRASDLEITNRELETFSYSVSHDLQQPVSGIAGFSSMALEDFGDGMHPEVQQILTRIQAASFRMSQLIEGLLALSSIVRAEIRRETVDLGELAQDAILELRASHPRRKAEIVIADRLIATGDRKLLQVLVNNLLGNAWKYTAKTPKPRIEMGTAQTDKGCAYFVRDNGAGFDPAQATKLFGPFQRLHSASEFPGTGIGLATVYRIVTRHGGKIWADAHPGEGATFYFTLSGANSEATVRESSHAETADSRYRAP